MSTPLLLALALLGLWAVWGSVRADNDRGMVWEVFDHRTPEHNIATARTEVGARVLCWIARKRGNGWVDFARAGEGW